MNEPQLGDYQATYRRSELALPLLVGIALIAGGAMTLLLLYVPGSQLETMFLTVAGVTLIALLSCLVILFRVHRWTLKQDGIAIHERPKVPLAGLSHRAFVAYGDIIAFRDVQSGFDYLIEIVARNGRRYRMAQAMVQEKGKRFLSVDMNARLGDLAASIRAAAAQAGQPLPATTQGMSFWNTIPGLGFLAFLLVASLAISGVVAWALLQGFTTRQTRGGEAIALALLLPVGAFMLLRKMWLRRREVLQSLRQASPVQR